MGVKADYSKSKSILNKGFTIEEINIPEEFFYAIQEKMGGNLDYELINSQDKKSFILALKVILELTSYKIQGE